MATTLFLDTFTGPAGNLAGHVPDVSPGSAAWGSATDQLSLNGSGQALRAATGANWGAHSVDFTGNELNVSAGYTVSADMVYLYSGVGADPGDDIMVVRFKTENNLFLFSSGHNFLVIEATGTGIEAYAVHYDSANVQHQFAPVAVSPGTHELKVVASLTEASFYIDGVLQETIATAAPRSWVVNISCYGNFVGDVAANDLGFSRIQVTTLGDSPLVGAGDRPVTITLPAGTPAFLREGHAIDPVSAFAQVPMRTGHSRKRRIFTVAPRIVSVQLQLNQAPMTALDDWYENTLHAGERRFAAQVQNQGPGLRWWEAQWLEPYTAEQPTSAVWRVRGQLLLTGEGSETAPDTSALDIEFNAALSGSAALTVGAAIAAEILAALVRSTRLAAEFVAALLHVAAPDNLRLEAGEFLLAESGDTLVSEAGRSLYLEAAGDLLQENGDDLLIETGSEMLLETGDSLLMQGGEYVLLE